ncbi:MAG TPA: PQQ-binding-like beta-propeller repeat protein [Ktedonosporobacter sp.]|nr:PQQ-binding-like beta-propeller repeat protein [Ktedonosporobacter sp.]
MKKRATIGLLLSTLVLILAVIVGSWAQLTHLRGVSKTATPTPHPPARPPMQDNIYIGSNRTVYKLDGRNGRVIWKQPLTRSVPLDIHVGSHFRVHILDGVVYAFLDHDFSAFRADTGQPLWHQHIEAHGSLSTENLRIYDEILSPGTIYLLHANATISARRMKDGSELWSNFTIRGDSFFVSNKSIYARVYSEQTRGNIIFALDAATGRERWHFLEQGLSGEAPIIAANGMVYVADHSLWALNEQTGQPLWTQTLSNPDQFFTFPRLIDGTLYVSTGVSAPMSACPLAPLSLTTATLSTSSPSTPAMAPCSGNPLQDIHKRTGSPSPAPLSLPHKRKTTPSR